MASPYAQQRFDCCNLEIPTPLVPIKDLIIQSNTPWEVANSLVENIHSLLAFSHNADIPSGTLLQYRALKDFQCDKRFYTFGSKPIGRQELVRWFQFFDSFFFGKRLEDYCYVELLPTKKGNNGRMIPAGSSNFRKIVSFKGKKQLANIEININGLGGNVPQIEQNIQHIETLLHEMLHAFISIFGKRHPAESKPGHGKPWQLGFMVLQEACWQWKLIDKMSANFAYNREKSLCHDMRAKDKRPLLTGDQIEQSWDRTAAPLASMNAFELEAFELSSKILADLWEHRASDELEIGDHFFSSCKARFTICPRYRKPRPSINDPDASLFWLGTPVNETSSITQLEEVESSRELFRKRGHIVWGGQRLRPVKFTVSN